MIQPPINFLKLFKADLAELAKHKNTAKDLQNQQMSSGKVMLNAVKGEELRKFLVREQLSIRITTWILNKALLASMASGGLGRYLEDLIVKDLKLKILEKDLQKSIYEKNVPSSKSK